MSVKVFFKTAIISMLTLGASWGIYLLVQLALGQEFTKLNVLEINAHGIAQIYGWIAMVIVGASYHLFPRILQTAVPYAYLIRPVWLCLVVGTTVSILALLLPSLSVFMLLGGSLILLGVTLFVWQMLTLLGRSSKQSAALLYLKTAFVFLFLSTVYNLWHHVALVEAFSQESRLHQVATFQAPLRDLQVHGVGLFMVLGVMQLVFCETKKSFQAYGILLLGVIGESSLFVIYRISKNHVVAASLMLPWLLLLVGSLILLVQGPMIKKLPTFAKLASLWLLFSLTLLVFLPFYSFVSGLPFSHAYYGAIRHAVTVGFLSQMIMGMIPLFLEKTLIGLAVAILNVGCLGRVILQILTDFSAEAFLLIPISGLLELSALIIWSYPLLTRDSLGSTIQNKKLVT